MTDERSKDEEAAAIEGEAMTRPMIGDRSGGPASGAAAEAEGPGGAASQPAMDEDSKDEASIAALEERVRDAVAGLFERLGAEVTVEVRETEETIDCMLHFGGRDAVLDVLPREELLESAQYVLQRMVYRDADAGKRVSLEIGSSLAPSDPAMSEMARRLAGAVQRMNRAVTIVPIHARDRKAIHQALTGDDGVETRSEGEGLLRRLVIEKK